MSVLVTCRRCHQDFEIDGLLLAGQWWDQCPTCSQETEEQLDEESAGEEPVETE
jgi:hypothetical protein